jgi:cytochrome bd ubiquinol oxidase subunit II
MIMFWATLLAVSILMYVLLDGFDLGIGMLFGLAASERRRHAMIDAVAPIWDGNETWLVVSGVILWGAFPVVYSILMSAFYLPVLLMLAGLILRGVAFEFRSKAERLRWVWNASFAGGSLVAAFAQGLMVGALVEGLPLFRRPIRWRRIRLVQSLCGALRDRPVCRLRAARRLLARAEMRRRDPRSRLSPHPLPVGGAAGFSDRRVRLRAGPDFAVMTRWLDRRSLFVFPVVGALAAITLAASVHRRHDALPFPMVAVIFVAAFCTLAISFWPYMVPFSITVEQAAAPYSSLAFMFWGAGLVVFPLMLLYTAISLTVFRGKVVRPAD